MPLYDAVRQARRTLLLGDLGTGKSTLATQLVIDTTDKSSGAVGLYVPVKGLVLEEPITTRTLVQSIER